MPLGWASHMIGSQTHTNAYLADVQGGRICAKLRFKVHWPPLLQATLGAMLCHKLTTGCNASEGAANVHSTAAGRTACFETQTSHSRPGGNVCVGSLAPAAFSDIAFVSNRASTYLLRMIYDLSYRCRSLDQSQAARETFLAGCRDIQPARPTTSRTGRPASQPAVKQF